MTVLRGCVYKEALELLQNKRGPRTEPCGTHHTSKRMGLIHDQPKQTASNNFNKKKYKKTKLIQDRFITVCSLVIRIPWSLLSKVTAKSK